MRGLRDVLPYSSTYGADVDDPGAGGMGRGSIYLPRGES